MLCAFVNRLISPNKSGRKDRKEREVGSHQTIKSWLVREFDAAQRYYRACRQFHLVEVFADKTQ